MSRFKDKEVYVEDIMETQKEWFRKKNNHQRFGQYVYNKYFREAGDESWPELFHCRSVVDAWEIILEDMRN